jgi:hypothetical protein
MVELNSPASPPSEAAATRSQELQGAVKPDGFVAAVPRVPDFTLCQPQTHCLTARLAKPQELVGSIADEDTLTCRSWDPHRRRPDDRGEGASERPRTSED